MPLQGEASNELGIEQTAPGDYFSRFQQLKNIEGYKNELIEVCVATLSKALDIVDRYLQDLLFRYGQLTEQFKKVTLERESEVEYVRMHQRREAVCQENISRLQSLMDQDPFVTVLLDASSAIVSVIMNLFVAETNKF